MITFGIAAAIVAFFAWGFGDFSIQRTVRHVGALEALFYIGLFGAVILTPIVWGSIPTILFDNDALPVFIAALTMTILAALLEFEAFGRGKLSVIEPIMSLELVVTVAIGLFFLKEAVTGLQGLLILAISCGIVLTVIRHEPRHWWKLWKHPANVERGIILGITGAFTMALVNVFAGLSSQATSPLEAIWFIHTGIGVFSFLVLTVLGRLRRVIRHAVTFWKPVLAESILDNTAWIAYATAVTVLPISITIGLTESYIALAAFLGILFNRERLQPHQFLGMTIALLGAITLAAISS